MAGTMKHELKLDELDFTQGPVSEAGRMGKTSLFMAWWGVCSAMFYVVVSAALSLKYGTLNAIIGLILTVLTYGIINSIITKYAIKTGLSVGLFSKTLFGKTGSALATLIFFATALYYAVFESSVIAVAINKYFPSIQIEWAYLFVVIYSTIFIFGSVQNWLDKLNGILLPLYIIGLIVAVLLTIQNHGYSNEWLKIEPEGYHGFGWWHCFTYMMGVWILMLYTWDFARFGRQEDTSFHANVTFGIPFYVVTFFLSGLVGIFITYNIPDKSNLSEISVVFELIELMGIWGLLLVWVTQTRINTANYYLATINFQSFIERLTNLHLPKIVCAVMIGVAVYFLMLTNVFSFILQALAYQSIFVVAWVGVALSHILLGLPPDEDKSIPAIKNDGIASWFLASGAGILVMEFGDSIASFSGPLSFIISFASYWYFKNKKINLD